MEARLSDYSSYPVEMPAWGDIKPATGSHRDMGMALDAGMIGSGDPSNSYSFADSGVNSYKPTPPHEGSFGANAAATSTGPATEPMKSEQMKSAADLLARSRQTRRRLGGTAHDVSATR
jgi:hypothetical protein